MPSTYLVFGATGGTGSDFVVCMLGEKEVQKTRKICVEFVKDRLVPSMRRCGFKGRFLYQAGGLTCPPGESLSWTLWTIRNTIARGFIGQHEDNEAVMEFLHKECGDLEWMVHLAGIGGDGATKGRLERSKEKFSIGNHRDCAEFSLRVMEHDEAVRGWWFSRRLSWAWQMFELYGSRHDQVIGCDV
ncbi:uncharacterized protein MYCFIDRAFT_76977, partial [Pseudocercospora fijiensis CIRAD86]